MENARRPDKSDMEDKDRFKHELKARVFEFYNESHQQSWRKIE